MKLKKILMCAIIAVVLLTTIVCVVIGTGITNPLQRQLSLGYKYLEAGNYEEAILAFNKAIEINDKNIEAYKGLAYTYYEANDEYSVDDIVNILDKAFENTNSDEVAKVYADIADKLKESERYRECYELLQAGIKTTNDQSLKDRLNDFSIDTLMKDVKDSLNQELIDEFDNFVGATAASGVGINGVDNTSLLYNYDCDSNYNERNLIWLFMSDVAGSYLRSITNFKWDAELVSGTSLMRVPEEQMQWVLKNYYNITPSETLNKIEDSYGPESVYLFDGFYYAPTLGRGIDTYKPYVENVYDLGDDRYYFIYKIGVIALGDTDLSEVVSDNYYTLLERRDTDNVEYWSFIKSSQKPIPIDELLAEN